MRKRDYMGVSQNGARLEILGIIYIYIYMDPREFRAGEFKSSKKQSFTDVGLCLVAIRHIPSG